MELSASNVLIVILFLLATYKNLPFVWFFRFFRTLITRLYIAPAHQKLTPACLFLPAIHRTRSPLTECDHNMHKSNSTYFTDLDISRGSLVLLLFVQRLSFRPTPKTATIILGGVQIVFRKEILPYQGYEVWSRVLSWDEKWVYIVSHFVRRGAVRHRGYLLQGRGGIGGQSILSNNGAGGKTGKEAMVFASAVSRYVFKQGRRTVPPEQMLFECGLLPKENHGEEWEGIEARRKRDLEAAQLKTGWDAVHACFDADEGAALGRYTDLLWR
ncbi:hypothetical protein BDW59DRAFT_171724 [Aspergillus cavernicola]|uniref:Capsule polysaccharide biosynthesis protein n=1 Tax=Aspergillus cavernicola TaxID=176166 RepID=A0ABR4IFV0_9EURO